MIGNASISLIAVSISLRAVSISLLAVSISLRAMSVFIIQEYCVALFFCEIVYSRQNKY